MRRRDFITNNEGSRLPELAADLVRRFWFALPVRVERAHYGIHR
jgi:hypothetical protein